MHKSPLQPLKRTMPPSPESPLQGQLGIPQRLEPTRRAQVDDHDLANSWWRLGIHFRKPRYVNIWILGNAKSGQEWAHPMQSFWRSNGCIWCCHCMHKLRPTMFAFTASEVVRWREDYKAVGSQASAKISAEFVISRWVRPASYSPHSHDNCLHSHLLISPYRLIQSWVKVP
jgi:hypothetical protein